MGTDLSVAPIGLDGGVFGWVSGSKETVSMLDAFVAAGGNLVYTADHYAGGRSEVMIGSWLRASGKRDSVVIATTIGQHPDARGLSPRVVTRATEASLRRFGVDHIDILTLDGADPSVPIDDTLEAVDMLRRAGKITHLAAIGHSAARIRAMRERAEEARYPTVAGVFEEYSLMSRNVFERELAPLVDSTGAAFFARRPLAHGFLVGDVASRAVRADTPIWGKALDHVGRRGSRVLERLGQVATEHGISLARTAAAWAISKPGVTAAILAARSPQELQDVMEARQVNLTRQQVAALDAVSA